MLDTPVWTRKLEIARFDGMLPFENFLGHCREVLQCEMVDHQYDTFSSLIQFHADYRKSGLALVNFVSGYNVNHITSNGLSCVGLSLSLIKNLSVVLPAYSRSISLVSCEEVVKDYGSYCIESPNTLKEHVLVCIRVKVAYRYGFVLFDPGYHVARPIVVMEDEQYPHTSWFEHSTTSTVTKEYCYSLIDDRFMAWQCKETRKGVTNQWSNLIFVQKAFAKCYTITQKRALFYAFKSLVIRDRDGPIAGIYCWLKSNSLTIFYPETKGGQRKQVKYPIAEIGGDEVNSHLENLAKHFKGQTYSRSLNFLTSTMSALKSILADEDFIEEMVTLDDWIEEEA